MRSLLPAFALSSCFVSFGSTSISEDTFASFTCLNVLDDSPDAFSSSWRAFASFFSPEFVSAHAALLDFTGIYDESLPPVSQVTLALSFPVTWMGVNTTRISSHCKTRLILTFAHDFVSQGRDLVFSLSFVIARYDNIATDESAPVREGQGNCSVIMQERIIEKTFTVDEPFQWRSSQTIKTLLSFKSFETSAGSSFYCIFQYRSKRNVKIDQPIVPKQATVVIECQLLESKCSPQVERPRLGKWQSSIIILYQCWSKHSCSKENCHIKICHLSGCNFENDGSKSHRESIMTKQHNAHQSTRHCQILELLIHWS